MKQCKVWIEQRQYDALKSMAERTAKPVSELVREGLERVLELAETQQDTLERVLVELDAQETALGVAFTPEELAAFVEE